MPPNRNKIGASLIGKSSFGAGGGGGNSEIRVPEKEIFNHDIRGVLVQWLRDHKNHPYATEGEIVSNGLGFAWDMLCGVLMC